MSELRTLYRHATHYLGGRVCLMLLGFVSFPLFTRVFSVADYGTMGLVLKIVLLLTVLGKFGLQNSVQRFYAEDGASYDSRKRQQYYSSLFFGALAVGVLATLIAEGTIVLSPRGSITGDRRHLLLLSGILILIRSLQPTLIGFIRAEGKTKTYNFVEIAVKVGTILLVCVLLLEWKQSLTVFFGSTIAVETAGVMGLALYLYNRELLNWNAFNWQYFTRAATFAFPLIGYELATVVLDSGDRLLIQHYMGAEPLGYYSAAYNVSTYVEESLMVPINLALFPIYMRLWVEKGQEETQAFLSRSLNNFLILAVGIVCVVSLTSHDVIVILASRKFQEAHKLLPLLVVGLLVYAVHIFLNAALLIHKKTGTMTVLVVYACALNLLLNILLIPRIGLQGAAVATLLSYLFLVIVMGRISFRLIPLRVRYGGLAFNFGAAILTYTGIRQLQFQHAWLNVAAKGTLALVVYGALVYLFNPEVRAAILTRFGSQLKIKVAGPTSEAS